MKMNCINLIVAACCALLVGLGGQQGGDRIATRADIPSSFFRPWYSQGDTLKGLDGIHVVVILDDDAKSLRLSGEALEAQIRLQLGQSGVPVISPEQYARSPIVSSDN